MSMREKFGWYGNIELDLDWTDHAAATAIILQLFIIIIIIINKYLIRIIYKT